MENNIAEEVPAEFKFYMQIPKLSHDEALKKMVQILGHPHFQSYFVDSCSEYALRQDHTICDKVDEKTKGKGVDILIKDLEGKTGLEAGTKIRIHPSFAMRKELGIAEPGNYEQMPMDLNINFRAWGYEELADGSHKNLYWLEVVTDGVMFPSESQSANAYKKWHELLENAIEGKDRHFEKKKCSNCANCTCGKLKATSE